MEFEAKFLYPDRAGGEIGAKIYIPIELEASSGPKVKSRSSRRRVEAKSYIPIEGVYSNYQNNEVIREGKKKGKRSDTCEITSNSRFEDSHLHALTTGPTEHFKTGNLINDLVPSAVRVALKAIFPDDTSF